MTTAALIATVKRARFMTRVGRLRGDILHALRRLEELEREKEREQRARWNSEMDLRDPSLLSEANHEVCS